MKTIAHSILVALPLILAPGAFAQHQTFTVNPDASQRQLSRSMARDTMSMALFMCRADQSTSTAAHKRSRGRWLWVPPAATAATRAATRK